MNSAISFDEMRFLMYQNGKIGPYELGVATSKEMLEVLYFAATYYQTLQEKSALTIYKSFHSYFL